MHYALSATLVMLRFTTNELWLIATWRLMNLGGEIDEASG